jgi:hypothetical protein
MAFIPLHNQCDSLQQQTNVAHLHILIFKLIIVTSLLKWKYTHNPKSWGDIINSSKSITNWLS